MLRPFLGQTLITDSVEPITDSLDSEPISETPDPVEETPGVCGDDLNQCTTSKPLQLISCLESDDFLR